MLCVAADHSRRRRCRCCCGLHHKATAGAVHAAPRVVLVQHLCHRLVDGTLCNNTTAGMAQEVQRGDRQDSRTMSNELVGQCVNRLLITHDLQPPDTQGGHHCWQHPCLFSHLRRWCVAARVPLCAPSAPTAGSPPHSAWVLLVAAAGWGSVFEGGGGAEQTLCSSGQVGLRMSRKRMKG